MRHYPVRWIALAVTVLLTAAVAPAAAAAAPSAAERAARAEHQRIVDFWTPARVAKAVPRDLVLDRASGKVVVKAKPTRPGGGGTTSVTGASWTGGGAVVASTGKVLFALSGTYYVCSASVVKDTASNRSLILTAAHCVNDETTGSFATNWMFIPDYDSNPVALDTAGSFCAQTTYGCWTASALVVRREWATAGGLTTTALTNDFAFAVVGPGGKGGTQLDTTVGGGQNIAFSTVSSGATTTLFGYPAAGKYAGKDLVYSRGSLGTDPLTGGVTYRVGSDMTGGSSGGPWFSPFTDTSGTGTVMSLNSYGYNGITAMHGPKFNARTQSLYSTALTATGNTPVG